MDAAATLSSSASTCSRMYLSTLMATSLDQAPFWSLSGTPHGWMTMSSVSSRGSMPRSSPRGRRTSFSE